MRQGLRKDNGAFANLFFLLRKIWSLGGILDGKERGFYYELEDGLLSDSDDLQSVSKYNDDVLLVPETEVVPVQLRSVDAIMKKADETNAKLLARLIAAHKRLTVSLNYTCVVTLPPEDCDVLSFDHRRNSAEYQVEGRELQRGPNALVSLRSDARYTYNMAKVLKKWPNAQINPHVLNTLPPPRRPDERYPCRKRINLHSIALNTLVEFTRAGSPESLLRAHPNSLRAVHVFALALSGVLRNALGEVESHVEQVARGKTVADIPPKGMVSLLFSSGAGPTKRDRWTDTDERKYFVLSNDEYVMEELSRKFNEGTWTPVPGPLPAPQDGHTSTSRNCTMDFFSF